MSSVIYTSGSTGTPKGVGVAHRQLFNYLHGILERLALPEKADFATMSSIAVDLGNTAVLPSLCTGGRLHVIAEARTADPHALADYFAQHPIDCLKIVPSHLATLLTSSHAATFLPRKRLILGGESSHWALIENIQTLHPHGVILNHYGPTEATIGVTTYRVASNPLAHASKVLPIGRPIRNTELYVLDADLQLVPEGIPGELYIGGVGLARGYVNQPARTAERFIPNPFSHKPGARIYRTGDEVRILPDGNLEFLGRLDHQVKLRGYRIEPGEIEAALERHPAIRQAVVMALEKTSDNTDLVAYLVANRESVPTTSALQRFLKTTLPTYMVPSTFVSLNVLPLTPSGKIDRRALPTPAQTRPELTETYVAPRTQVEHTLTAIWQEVLSVEQVGIHDNFFDLGGHSLLIVRLHSRLRDLVNKDISIVDLFTYPTIHSLASYIQQNQSQNSSFQSSYTRAVDRHESLRRRRQFRQNTSQ